MMPFLCYYLQVHDCMIAILGSIFIVITAQWQCDIISVAYLLKKSVFSGALSGIEEYLVWAFATKGEGPKSQSWKSPDKKHPKKPHHHRHSRLAHVFGLCTFITQVGTTLFLRPSSFFLRKKYKMANYEFITCSVFRFQLFKKWLSLNGDGMRFPLPTF